MHLKQMLSCLLPAQMRCFHEQRQAKQIHTMKTHIH